MPRKYRAAEKFPYNLRKSIILIKYIRPAEYTVGKENDVTIIHVYLETHLLDRRSRSTKVHFRPNWNKWMCKFISPYLAFDPEGFIQKLNSQKK